MVPVAALDWHRFPRVEPDSDRKWKGRASVDLPAKAQLQLDCGPQRLPGRTEDAERLVAAKLDHLAPGCEDRLPGQLRAGGGERACGLIAVLLREAGVAPNVGDQERADRRRE